MNPIEEKLAQFAKDDVMFVAVKQRLFALFDANDLKGVERSERDAAVQAIFDGRGRLEEGFKSIEKYKNPPKQEKDDTNPAV